MKLTFWPHSNAEALFESTLLTLASHVHVDLAVVAILALVDGVFGDAAPEEACKKGQRSVSRISFYYVQINTPLQPSQVSAL